jgi:hypothetical protein|uniref:hypothetical protein n=1 Tax=Algoriphagus sp. TaxID=1872435 RepID=UPI00404855FF
MENLSIYFFIALALSIAFYTYFKKNKVAHPTADEVRVFNPKAKTPAKPRAAAASKPSPKKPQPKKSGQGPKKEKKATGTAPRLSSGLGTSEGKPSGNPSSLSDFDLMGELSLDSMGKGNSKSLAPSQTPSTPSPTPNFDLETEVKQLQARTGWNYAKAKAYCKQAVEYHKKITAPTRLKKNN